jgi:hypothetical protein
MGRIETERLLAVARDGRRAWQLAAEQCQMRGERSQALEFFRGAYERRPDLTEIQSAIRELGGAEVSVNRRSVVVAGEDEIFQKARGYESLARETFARVGDVSPDSYRAHEVLADSLAVARRRTEAIAEYRVCPPSEARPSGYSSGYRQRASIGGSYGRGGAGVRSGTCASAAIGDGPCGFGWCVTACRK